MARNSQKKLYPPLQPLYTLHTSQPGNHRVEKSRKAHRNEKRENKLSQSSRVAGNLLAGYLNSIFIILIVYYFDSTKITNKQIEAIKLIVPLFKPDITK